MESLNHSEKRIIEILASSGKPLNTLEVCKLFKSSYAYTYKTLWVLEMHGVLVKKKVTGQRSVYYCLNKSHPLVKGLIN